MWRVPAMLVVLFAVTLRLADFALLLAAGVVLCALELHDTVKRR